MDVYFRLVSVYWTYLQPGAAPDMGRSKIDSSDRLSTSLEECDLVLMEVSDQ
jgi:hypothetical protein